ncbi:MAG: 4Fe-4S binding protein [Campylobacteraceae bacterium]|nr:4Fe-4S binding protein [Campylobacteraceae bacterium]
MKEIVIVSGKGGTGKTSISAAFAALKNEDAIACDCDVDAANMYILLGADFKEKEDFKSGHQAFIVQEKCRSCGKCMKVCRFDAISLKEGRYFVEPFSCEGCHYCATICPTGAIEMIPQIAGESYCSSTRFGGTLVHAKLAIGAEMSGKLIAHAKTRAREAAKVKNAKYIIVDGSPGIGCSVVSSLSGANLVVFVTEATISGLHDLKRVYALSKTFNLPSVIILNKSDLNEDAANEIEAFASSVGVKIIGRLGYKKEAWEALGEGKTLLEVPALKGDIMHFWEQIEQNL